ncbi:TolC family protein [Sulfurimonas crateris]|uniref:TolC family protein n=1 Tax=Sulfurimonas crateris TaxID=2574727 RepID=A0A4U2Z691_9BACT|nr:TolC family protein [Sulfurimonas crateris]TKI69728.1 TolC family protein [Sulfurimonas crateris]
MIKLLFLMLPFLAAAESLQSILEYAYQNNNNIKSSKYIKESKLQEVESKKSGYLPTVDIGASYTNTSDRTVFQIKDVYAGYAKAEFDIYDGGARSALVQKAKDEFSSSLHDEESLKQELSLEIVGDFYTILTLQASLRAKEDAKKSLHEQLERVKQFRGAGLATEDDVERLRASYERALYEIESLSYELLERKSSLELKVGREIESFDDSHFKEVDISDIETKDAIKSLIYKERALKNSADAIESIYYPNIKAEDTYTVYEYGDIAEDHFAKIDRQNVFMLTLNMRIFDYSATKEQRDSLLLNAKALNEKIKYMSKEQKLRYGLSKERIKSAKVKIKSAKSSLVAASSAFKTINEKYSAGLVDYVIYLDALSAKTDATSLYESSLNDLQVAYAAYYFYSGRNLEEFIQ